MRFLRFVTLIQNRFLSRRMDLAVMSIEAYEELTSRFELYSKLKEGMDDIASGNTRPFSEAISDIRRRHNR